jgi:hypothetical protein
MRPEGHAQAANIAALQARLKHVYWIGGGSGAGKSTIARRMADLRGLQLYATDSAMAQHDARSRTDDAPLLSRFKAMDMDQRWVHRSAEAMFEAFHWFHGELFNLIVEDLLRLPAEPGAIAEGFRLLPQLVRPLLADPRHAVWFLPTPGFRRAAFASRGSLSDIAGKTSDPDKALRNLLERDRMFTELLRRDTKRLDRHAIEIDAGMTEDDLMERVTEIFGL